MNINSKSRTSLPLAGSRRAFLSDMGMGFTGLALGAMLQRDGVIRAAGFQTTGAATESEKCNLDLSGGWHVTDGILRPKTSTQ